MELQLSSDADLLISENSISHDGHTLLQVIRNSQYLNRQSSNKTPKYLRHPFNQFQKSS